MARIRTIKPTFWESQQLGQLDTFARFTFIGLISLADDEGRGIADVRFLLGRLHPFSSDVDSKDLDKALATLAEVPETGGAPLVVLYEYAAGRYYWLPSFDRHQYIPRKSDSKLPAPPKLEEVIENAKKRVGKPVATEPKPEPKKAEPEKPQEPPKPRPKTNQQLIVEAFATNRHVDLGNSEVRDRFFKANAAAAVSLDKMCNGDLQIALMALNDIARYLDAKVKEGAIAEWRHLEAVNNNFLEWRKAYDQKRGKNG